jgi:diadenosine tetraphosphate (Ap4A) HIT family hydrolase
MFDPNNPCLFCNREPEKIIAETKHAFLTSDDFPVNKGHLLIIPKRHFATQFDATEEENNDFHHLLLHAKQHLDETYQPDGYNIGSNNAEAAGQSVHHLHIHIIPRYKGDVENPKGGVRWVIAKNASYSLADL